MARSRRSPHTPEGAPVCDPLSPSPGLAAAAACQCLWLFADLFGVAAEPPRRFSWRVQPRRCLRPPRQPDWPRAPVHAQGHRRPGDAQTPKDLHITDIAQAGGTPPPTGTEAPAEPVRVLVVTPMAATSWRQLGYGRVGLIGRPESRTWPVTSTGLPAAGAPAWADAPRGSTDEFVRRSAMRHVLVFHGHLGPPGETDDGWEPTITSGLLAATSCEMVTGSPSPAWT